MDYVRSWPVDDTTFAIDQSGRQPTSEVASGFARVALHRRVGLRIATAPIRRIKTLPVQETRVLQDSGSDGGTPRARRRPSKVCTCLGRTVLLLGDIAG